MVKLICKKLDFSDASYSIGGNGRGQFSKQCDQSIECNIVKFNSSLNNNFNLIAIDALYPGKIAKSLPLDKTIICASHSHYSPMIDDQKPKLGEMSHSAFTKWFDCIISTDQEKHTTIDECIHFKAEVPVHIYRRLDYPHHVINRFLNPRVGLFPNETFKIDSHVYVWLFNNKSRAKFAFAYHAGHPVTRHDSLVISSDYVGVIRSELRKRFGNIPIIFMQGCGADIRPNVTTKRRPYLPKLWLNKCFKSPPSQQEQLCIDDAYKSAIKNLTFEGAFVCDEKKIRLSQKTLTLKGQKPIYYPMLSLSNIFDFHFFPFELSHLFHLDTQRKAEGSFLVSCSQDTLGYLPHPKQLRYGGYEVDKSRTYMGLKHRQELLESEILL